MSSEKPNFLSQPVVKSVFMFRNGDPHYDARRIVINQKRVCNFETLMREVTSGIQAPFGAVRNIYTPRGGHRVDCMESLQSGEQYVAAGRERFKKLDYLQIGYRKKRMLQTLPMQAKPLPQHRIIVSARFLKPIKEPCPIFVVANGDVLNPAMRVLIHQRMLGQFDKILEMITERMGLRCLGGVRSLYTCEGHQVTDANQLESGQLYVALGRERFKKLPYSDLLFTKPRGTRRINGMKAYTLPPIYRFSKQNGNSKSMVRCSDSGDGESKSSPLGRSVNNNKEHLSSIVREISQARLISFRKKRSGQSMTLGISDNDDLESKAGDGNTEGKSPQDEPEEKPAAVDTKASEENGEKAEKKEETPAENTTEEETSAGKEETEKNGETSAQIEGEEKKENEDTSSQKEGEEKEENEETSAQKGGDEKEENKDTSSQKEGEEMKENEGTSAQIEGEEKKENKETSAQVEGEEKKENKETKEGEDEKENEKTNNEKEGKATAGLEGEEGEQGSSNSNDDKTQDRKETEDGKHSSSDHEKDEQNETVEDETQDKDSGKEEESSKEPVNDVDIAEEQKEKENSSDPGKTQSDNETKENGNGRSSSSNGNQEENVSETKGDATKESGEEERGVNGELSRDEDEVESEAELEVEEKHSASHEDVTADGEKGDKSRKGEDLGKKEK